ncbi:hypothetical protein L211DRAFT_847533 [Terfezia boudieri ATCC MYA-4762]|uniref:Retrovirus-related Pol polyprotein from transposon TNT 1-94-like beta-barrel domain-containing protein n=1 Tax=Terfezia boudieri ATCC MYA-4762 TaxID=1051890 RepID=A0A3N4LXU6_9PEZI|nr:hypothetical protein L211DRAFT_847533 [Terfezia boudieri ATCC MYA-4762]
MANPAQGQQSGYQTAYQNPAFLGNASLIDIQGFVGPTGSTIDKHATVHMTLADLNGKSSFGKEFAYSTHKFNPTDKEIGGVGPLDEPGKWLVDTGASNHFSPFKHFFLSLIPCNQLVEVLTGNGWVYAYYYGTIPLIIKVNSWVLHVHLENVLYIPTLQTRVNLFSVVVVADRGYNTDFGSAGVQFRLDELEIAGGWTMTFDRMRYVWQYEMT